MFRTNQYDDDRATLRFCVFFSSKLVSSFLGLHSSVDYHFLTSKETKVITPTSEQVIQIALLAGGRWQVAGDEKTGEKN